jgi:ankyrin repeat protein
MNSFDEELIEAAGENNQPEVRRLLSVGADVNAKDRRRRDRTPIHKASSKGHLQVVKVLHEHGADMEATTIYGQTALHLSCGNDHLAVVTELLSPSDSNGATSILGKRKSRRGANIEAKNNYGETPLHIASIGGYLPVVKALVSGGADILAVNNNGTLPIDRAVSEGHSAVAKYLLQELYAKTRHLPLHKLLEDLTWIGNPSSRDLDYPPLRSALIHDVLGTDDVVEILEFLVGHNPALISSSNQDRSLPLHVACRRGASFAIIQSLVDHYKASVKSVTSEGDLPLFLACETSGTSLDTIFLLMKLYPDLVYHRSL